MKLSLVQKMEYQDTRLINKFSQFMLDAEAAEMFVTGVAGTGKTTSLKELMDFCKDNGLEAVACAYTHKACGVLSSKLTPGSKVQTLHSYLKKCPTINVGAMKVAHVEGNSQAAKPIKVHVIFIDEFSMVGEKDYVDIADLQYDENGNVLTKVVYIGDPNQLPPVKDMQVVVPSEPYWIRLTKIHRQAEDNPLIDTLMQINGFLEGEEIRPLAENTSFFRGVDIVDLYRRCKGTKILLAYTNFQVQALNALVMGREKPIIGDMLFSPTTREHYTLEAIDAKVAAIVGIRGDMLELDSKYKTLETIHKIPGVQFFYVADDNGNSSQRAVIFGHDTYLQFKQELMEQAVKVNKQIETKFGEDPKDWSKVNWKHELAQKRKEAWKQYLAFKDYVLCIDFAHAMTVHKSQGSTYDYVFLDTDDMYKCAKSDFTMYLRLMYVAISRAAERVYTNQ